MKTQMQIEIEIEIVKDNDTETSKETIGEKERGENTSDCHIFSKNIIINNTAINVFYYCMYYQKMNTERQRSKKLVLSEVYQRNSDNIMSLSVVEQKWNLETKFQGMSDST
jgi:hypothetical protein